MFGCGPCLACIDRFFCSCSHNYERRAKSNVTRGLHVHVLHAADFPDTCSATMQPTFMQVIDAADPIARTTMTHANVTMLHAKQDIHTYIKKNKANNFKNNVYISICICIRHTFINTCIYIYVYMKKKTMYLEYICIYDVCICICILYLYSYICIYVCI